MKASIDTRDTGRRLAWLGVIYAALMLACAGCSVIVFRWAFALAPEPLRTGFGVGVTAIWCWMLIWLVRGIYTVELSRPETVACVLGCWVLTFIGVLNGVSVCFVYAQVPFGALHEWYLDNSIVLSLLAALVILAIIMAANTAANLSRAIYSYGREVWQQWRNNGRNK